MIAIVGLSHRTSDLPLREAMAFAQDAPPAALARLRAEARLGGAMILSTCNRVEIYGQADDADRLEERLADFLCAFHGRPRAELDAFVYRLAGAEAVRHAFRVAASLDSMVLGEPQILGQVKEAYRLAEEAGTLGSALIALRNRSLAAAKRARSETGIGQNAVSISYVAVELARKIFGSPPRPERAAGRHGQDERPRRQTPGERRRAGHRARRCARWTMRSSWPPPSAAARRPCPRCARSSPAPTSSSAAPARRDW